MESLNECYPIHPAIQGDSHPVQYESVLTLVIDMWMDDCCPVLSGELTED